ncbi:hypothetical protein AAFF_G00343290 [Aldrovandia affinis]|uniref:Uncharacterized protein n=1 Tax=Aldrovandia affinis TaxID=143900 RepID=A0AAD7WPV8_9TELE|nr:hypothetical protein AAFF_G00343290 [Aldrovandia affinis]
MVKLQSPQGLDRDSIYDAIRLVKYTPLLSSRPLGVGAILERSPQHESKVEKEAYAQAEAQAKKDEAEVQGQALCLTVTVPTCLVAVGEAAAG